MKKLLENLLTTLRLAKKKETSNEFEDLKKFIELKDNSTDDTSIAYSAKFMFELSFNSDGSYLRVQSLLPQIIVSDIMDNENLKDIQTAVKHYREYLLLIIMRKYSTHISSGGETSVSITSRNKFLSTSSFLMVYNEAAALTYGTDDMFNKDAWDIYNDRINQREKDYDIKHKRY